MLGGKLMKLRKKQGLSQQQAAELLDVTRQTISNWECGQAVPSLEKAAEMAALYHISLDDLVENDVEVVVKTEKTTPHADTHLLKMLIGKRCILECEDESVYFDMGGDMKVTVLDVNDEWIRVEYKRNREGALFQKETVVKLIELSTIRGFEIAEEQI